MKTIRLTTCQNIQEAALIKGHLENEGIPCILTNQNITTLLPHFNNMLGSGVQVLVDENDLEKAASIIFPDQDEPLSCPFCNSTNIKYSLGSKKLSKMFFILISALHTIPINNISKTYHCADCNSDFKTDIVS
ncbi:MAG: DUF2007 domain-containing protein [Clostridia bacterium]|nr:DUF2007 domain-containing protein [Clostridia bacterium]